MTSHSDHEFGSKAFEPNSAAKGPDTEAHTHTQAHMHTHTQARTHTIPPPDPMHGCPANFAGSA